MAKVKTTLSDPALIAPCGFNCRVCLAYIRDKNHCPGCRFDDAGKSKSCLACRIKNCAKLAGGEMAYCFECDSYPCARLAHLFKRYQTNYATSLMDNLTSIKENGVEAFVADENIKWACPECGAMLCIHRSRCLACGYQWRTIGKGLL